MVNLNFSPEKDVPTLAGKVIFITGGNAGLGAEAVLQFAKHGTAHIYFTGRNTKAAAEVKQKVKQAAPNVQLTFLSCNLTSLSHVKDATEEFQMTNQDERLDVLICEAGIMAVPPALTKDGYEIQFGTNHLGHALIIKKLLPSLLRTLGARIVNLTSLGFILHPKGGILFEKSKTTQASVLMGSWTHYAQSKLANIIYTRELARRYPTIICVAAHPSITSTDLINSLPLGHRTFICIGAMIAGGYLTPQQGAYNEIWAATADAAIVKSGEMYEPVGVITKQLNKDCESEVLAEELWKWTNEQLQNL